jgi:predicted HNH restriction endonuclease
MEQVNESQKWVTLFKEALLKVEPEIYEGQRKMLLGHYSAPGMALSVKRLAEIAGYEGTRSGSLHYGKLARKISEAMGTTTTGDQISIIAAWDGNQKDERGHGQWILFDEVAQAIEELGWVNIKRNLSQQDFPIPLGVEKPKEVVSQTIQRERDPLVRDWVARAANGICECCENPAPFELSDGSPYLEVHHIRHLVNDGSDKVSNAVAICPNCHRELHHGKHKDELVENLYACIPRLIRE